MAQIGRRRWVFAVPVLVVLAALFTLSSQSYREQDIRHLLSSDSVNQRLVHILGGVEFEWEGREMSVSSMGAHNLAEFIIRKSAHVMIYATLSFTLLLAFWMLLPWRKAFSVVSVIALIVLLAFADEYNQRFSGERTPSIADVGIDLVGAAIGICLFWFLHMLYQIYQARKDTKRNIPYD